MKTSLLANAAATLLLALPLAHAQSKPATTPAAKTLWDHWYTMTLNKKTAYGYYNEKVELRGEKIHFQNNLWKKEEGFINEEQLGTVATNDARLAPLYFNFHSTYRTTETTIDGTAKEGVLAIKVRQGEKELPLVKRTIPKDAIFSQFFPVWLGLKLPSMKAGETARFNAILEDNIDGGFAAVKGSAKLEKPDAFATQSKNQKVTIDFRGAKSTWWIDKNGSAVRIEMPSQGVLVERVNNAETAKKFLATATEE